MVKYRNKTYGNFKPRYHGLCLRVDNKSEDYVLYVVVGIAFSLIVYDALLAYDLWHKVSPVYVIFTNIIYVITFVFLALTTNTEPGIIPPQKEVELLNIVQSEAPQPLQQQESSSVMISANIRQIRKLIAYEDVSALSQYLSNNKCDINETEEDGRTPLHLAVIKGNIECVKIILAQYPLIFKRDDFLLYPLHYTKINKNKTIMDVIMNHLKETTLTGEEEYPFDINLPINDIRDRIDDEFTRVVGCDAGISKGRLPLIDNALISNKRIILCNGEVKIVKRCKKCNIFPPPRSFHCRTCDVCILRFDHHCPWVSNCIGLKNYRYFYAFLISTFLLLMIHTIQFIHFIIQNGLDIADENPDYSLGKKVGYTLLRTIIYLIYMIGVLFFIYPVSQLVYFHTNLVIMNQTTHEYLASFDNKYPYSEGIKQNIYDVLFRKVPKSLV